MLDDHKPVLDDHKQGGYNGPNMCRCADCKSAHARRMREYRRSHKKLSVTDLELIELRAFRDGVLSARAASS